MKPRIILALILSALQVFGASITCTFTASDNTLLEDYANGAEATWTEFSGVGSGVIQISDANRAHTTSTSTSVHYVDNFTPASYDYDVECTVLFKSVPTSNNTFLGIGGRTSSTSPTSASGYMAWVVRDAGAWEIQLARYGSAALTEAAISTPSVNDSIQLKLIMRGNVVKVNWNGSTVITYLADTSTANYLTSVGRATLYMDGVASHISDSTGLHVDDYTVTDGAAVNTTGTLAVDNDDLWFNVEDGTGNPRQSCFAEWRFTTNAQIIKVTGTTDMEDDKTTLSNMGIFVDEVYLAPYLDFTANGTQTFTYMLTSTLGATKTVRIVNSSQIYPSDEPYVQGSYIDSVELQEYFDTPTYTVIPPSDANKLLIYGDSIAVGDNASPAPLRGWTTMLRNRWGGRNVAVDAFGSRSLYEDNEDATARTAFAAKLASYNAQYLWMAIGTNDYGADQDWNATDFGTAYGDLLDKIHTAAPDLKIFCQSPIQRTVSGVDQTISEAANGEGSTLADYRSAISTAVSSRTSYCTYVDGTNGAIVPLGNTSDGIHPNDTGHRIYAEFVHQYLFGVVVGSSGTTTVSSSGTTIVK